MLQLPTRNVKQCGDQLLFLSSNSTFNEGILLRTAPDPPLGTPAPRSSALLHDDDGREAIPAFDLVHYVLRMTTYPCTFYTCRP